MTSPVLFIVFRRPAERVFAAIAAARPPTLFIAADGPANARDAASCAEVRRIVSQVTWPCEVQTDLSPVNLGCQRRVSSALDWFFGACESGIVLDCLPAPDFFRFCDAMLERYRDDERVVHVSGETYRQAALTDSSYSFSKYALIWGWASWRRAWHAFDLRMASWPAFRQAGSTLALYDSDDERRYWDATFQQMHEGRISTWDYAWIFACLAQGLSIHPAVNLVRNIGSGEGATHMTGASAFSARELGSLGEIRHPPCSGLRCRFFPARHCGDRRAAPSASSPSSVCRARSCRPRR